ncbi:type I polyketide synthase, partial [Spongiactinospora sp. TRM90649]|uniref:type I polyketide synthase n=1 Tax=Spongiactinospora sp. TRM90649 TaxID=3031114 RepID=UPI0023F6F1A4
RRTVRFEEAIRALLADGRSTFIEISAHPVLTMGIGDTVEAAGRQAAVLATLRRHEGDTRRWLTALAEAYVHGVTVDWTAVLPDRGGRRIGLPTYAFQRRRYWLETAEPEAAQPVSERSGDLTWFWDAVEREDLGPLLRTLDVSGETPLSAALSSLSSWHRRRREENTVDGWRYRVSWKPATTGGATLSGTWLAVVPEGWRDAEVTRDCLGALESAGARVVTLAVEDAGGDRATLAARIGDALAEADDAEPAGVVSLLALDEEPTPEHTSVPCGMAATVTLTHALRDARVQAPLWCLTTGAVSTGSADRLTHPAQALVWGFGRIAAHEYPTWGGLVDLPEAPNARALSRLPAVLAGGGDDDQVAVRVSGVFVPRLVRAGETPAKRSWSPSGTVLITGGTGAIGAHVARWLARRGAGHLLLVSRRGLAAPGAGELAAELESMGVTVTVAAADPADRDTLAGLLARIPAEHPLTAVFHAAGVVDSSIIDSLTPERIDGALRAKLRVAMNLHELTRDLDLSAFVLFSSLAGVFGAAGEGNYGPGNAFLDAFAAYRRGLGLPATAVAWGAWDGGGMAEGAIGDAMGRHGVPRMDPELALAALQRALDNEDTAIALADIRWEVFSYFFTATRPSHLLDELREVRVLAAAAEVVDEQDDGDTSLVARLSGLPDGERNRILLELVREQVALVLGYESAEAVEPGRTFQDLGLASAGAVELRNRLTLVTGLRVAATVVFDYPTAAELARHLDAQIGGGAAGNAATAAPVPAVVATDDDPIVIVGMSCRFPGGVASPEDLWDLVAGGGDAMSVFPADRGWDTDALYDPDPDNPGTTYAREGGFVHDATGFDAELFGISPREALAMDPQQRLMLEACWEVFERAGIDPMSLRGSQTAVYAGSGGQEYMSFLSASATGSEGYLATGGSASVVSGRVAYTFGLEGPAVTVDTACSSSLVAMHLAAQALRQGEATMAIAGGVTVLTSPSIFTEFSRQRGMAFDGRCKSFAADADGAGWGEGVGVVLLERLSDARRNGHEVLAVLRASAVNQDGASNGLTAPNGPSQQRVIRQALAGAGLSFADVDAVEAHGTGTALGDPIEAQALLATYGQDREKPLWLGSVKSNIGHTQAAAGMAGVIKMVMALRHQTLPRTLHVDEPTPHVDWTAGAVELLTENRPWKINGRPRRAGISSFGISGTNAHTIIEEPPAPLSDTPAPGAPREGEIVPWTLSARTAPALLAQAGRLLALAEADEELNLTDVAASLVTTRAALEHRAVVLAGDRAGLLRGLTALAEDALAPGLVRGVIRQGRTAFMFTGQGAQRPGMGRELYETFPVFADAFDAVAARLDTALERPLHDVVFADTGLLSRTRYTQAGLFALEVALFRLFESWGVVPDYLLGHSIGELAAAHVAGVMSLDDACRLVEARGRLMQELPEGGAMLALQAREDELELDERVSLAAVNGPDMVVLSGEKPAVAEQERLWRGRGRKCKRLNVSHAFHSVLMEPMLAEFRAVAETIGYARPAVPVVSNLDGRPVERYTAEYWVRHVREAVRFADGVATLHGHGVTRFVELGPDGVLTAMARQSVDDATLIPTLRSDRAEPEAVMTALATAHVHGVPVDWPGVLAERGGRRIELPPYPFQRRRYWPEIQPAVPGAVAADPAEAEFWAAVESEDLAAVAGTLKLADEDALAGLLPALSSWRRRRRAESALDTWRYRDTWRLLPDPATAALTGPWLVLGHRAGDTGPLATALRRAGAEPVELTLESAGADRDALTARLLDVPAPAGVLSLLGLTTTVTLVQALGDAGVDAPLWCATRDAVVTGPADGPPDPGQAQVWGFGRVAALEYPGRWGGLVDLPAELDERAAARLAAVLTGTEDQVAVRASGVFGRRLRHDPAGHDPELTPWRPSGAVLITGGTGALGAHAARWLAGRGAAKLVLAGRRGADAPGAAELVAELTELGAETVVATCDVADRDALAALLAEHPVTAVVHAAGVTADGLIDSLTPGRLALSLSAKAEAATHLHELTEGLEAFVLFSSMAGTLGNAGQAAYAAANAHLDALAERRRALGLPATSIAWGPWAGSGMAADEAVAQRMRRAGLPAIDPEQAVAALAQAVDRGDTAVTVVDVDWARFAPGFTAVRRSPLIADLPEAAAALADAAVAEAATGPDSPLRARVLKTPVGERERLLLDFVREHAALVLGHATPAAIEPERAFREFGFDSLTALELRNLLGTATALTLPASLVFDYPTPKALARHLLAELAGRPGDEIVPIRAGAVDTVADPIVIVGMSCRFPGGVSSPERLWEMVRSGTDAMTEFPSDRGWDLDALFDPTGNGTSDAREAGFLHDVAGFDAALFGISPREALAMDPQQRLLLESCWEVFESAGIDPTSVRGSQTGVFAGTNGQDYGTLLLGAAEATDGHLGTGNTASVMSGRISYTFGLEGPAVTVDTACSSSLVALHLAAQSLRQGECSMALAGGVTVMTLPGTFIEFSTQGGLSGDGRCKAFAEAADGTGWGEGVGMLLLERQSDARRNGHRVLAVVRGSAVNQDGASNGLTAPNGPSQQRVIRQALANARLEPTDVDAVEAHGTGTRLGDPIEAQALLATYGQDRAEPLWLGSIKSNIGHTQAAAGVAGVIKMVQAIRHGELPKTMHVDAPSSHVDWTAGAVELLTENRPWPGLDRPRRAAISSFGVSGTNAHVIIEQAEAEAEPEEAPEVSAPPVVPWVVSAKSAVALREQVSRLAAHTGGDPVDVAWSLATTRATLEHRAVLLGPDRTAESGLVTGVAQGTADPVFVFPGEGSRWIGAAAELLESSPVFAARMAECERALAEFVDWSLLEIISAGRSPDQVDMAESVLWAVSVSLAALWESAGVVPSAVVGHGQGEIAAAVVAGGLSLEDGARVVALCSQREQVPDLLMEKSAEISPTRGRIAYYSAVTGERVDTSTLNADHWYENLRRTVRFEEAIGALLADGRSTFIEISADPVLTAGIERALGDAGGVALATLRRDESGPERWTAALAEAWVHGVPVDWRTVFAGWGGQVTDLPTYAFQHERYWPDFSLSFEPGTATAADPDEAWFWEAVENGDLSAVAGALKLGDSAVDAVLPALSVWRRERRERSTVDSWRYRAEWTPITVAPATLSGTWLLVTTEHVPAAEVATAVRQGGADVVEVRLPGSDQDRWDLADTLANVVRNAGKIAGVLSLVALDPAAKPVAGTLALTQALGDLELGAPLWCATRGAVATARSEPPVDPAQVAVWGFGRSAALELPRRWGGLVDLPADLDARSAARLVSVLAAGDDEDQVAVRASSVFARRLRRASRPETGQAVRWTPIGTVLVTGGTGALGGHVARWLAGRGATDLLLTGRRGADAPGAAELVAELAELGARATVAACDVADRDALAALLAGHDVRAVFHTAGVAATASIPELDPASLADALAAKVTGAANLDELLPDAEAFVLFSSIAATWGSGGQTGYAAGNAYLDGLAERRRARGSAATSVAWGPWAAAGMAASEEAGRHLARRGLRAMPPEQAVVAMADAIDADETAVTVADVDWARFAPSFTVSRPSALFGALPEARDAAGATSGDADESSGLRGRIAASSPAERDRLLTDLVKTHLGAVLGYRDTAAIEPAMPFRDLGVDSLTAVEVRGRIAQATGLSLPASLVFDYPTPAALAAYLVGELGGTEDGTAAPVAPVAATETDPIAIVGMSCRFPGGVSSPEELWELLAAGGDGIAAFPLDRGWDLGEAGFAAEGGFVHEATTFDAELFGISPREATAMDPQQRLLLEASWEVLERAGIDPHALRGTPTGVFVGASASGYGTGALVPDASQGHLMTGTSNSVISGRVSYAFGLEGPAVTIDTACSSSLVALHLAAQALRNGECSMALAGGVTVMPTPTVFAEFSRQNGLAGDGRCKSFADAADGTGWGEGVGVLLVEKLSDARRNGHEVLAIVRGSAVNQDGASNGLTAPNGPSQQRVIRQALAGANLTTADIDVVEAHGTGTTLGDPIEAQALLATYGQDRDRPLWLGSLKSNIGHTQAASGVAGVIKMVLAIRHGTMPKTLHVDAPTRHVDWTAGAVELLTEARDWPVNGHPRRAGISSFGVSGTNAHTIIEEPPAAPEREASAPVTGPVAWPVSGRSPAALRAQAERLRDFTAAHDGLDPAAMGNALATTRAALGHRAVVVAEDRDGFLRGLEAIATGRTAGNVLRGVNGKGGLAFLFPGQGSQRPGMGRELYDAYPVFADAFDAIRARLDRHLDHPLADVVFGDGETGALDRTAYTQAALFAVEVALYRLVESWGITPDHLLGHSVGELAAAHVAGVMSLDDACLLVGARGRLMQALPEGGAMLAVQMTEADARRALEGYEDRVSVAAVNGREAIVVSGETAAIEELAALAEETKRKARRLPVSHAFHSPLMEPMLADFRRVAEGVEYRAPRVPIVSNLTGAHVEGYDAGYWVRHVREAVRFADGVTTLRDAGVTRVLEIGPGGALTALAEPVLPAKSVAVAALRKGRGELDSLLRAVGRLHANGVSPDWTVIFAGAGTVELPTYAFQRERYWLAAGVPATAPEAAPAAETPQAVPEGNAAVPEVRLAGLSRQDRAAALLDLVRQSAAAALGHATTDPIEPEWEFLELGFDSLAALELRNALQTATGLTLSATMVFDHPTPVALAEHLRAALEGTSGEENAGSAVSLGVSPDDRDPVGLLNSLYREATRNRKVADFLEFLGDAAKFRPAADRVEEITTPAKVVRLARGAAEAPPLICCSGMTAAGGPHEFARIAAPLRGLRDVSAVPALGYGRGELLPATAEVALGWQAEAVLRHAGGRPYVLLGHSGGAILAHALARHLDGLGQGPAALVLVDIYRPEDQTMTDWDVELSEGVFDREHQYVPMDDIRLTAMAWYGRIFWESATGDVAAPTLLLRATEPLGEVEGDEWRSSWEHARAVVDVPGDHFSMMSEHAETTALAIHHWIEETL